LAFLVKLLMGESLDGDEPASPSWW
jgi:hypothetical protein